jgi:hypothetical protein
MLNPRSKQILFNNNNKPKNILDADAKAFLNAAGITDPLITSAINTLVIDLKINDLWNKIQAAYPFVGGTSNTCKFNLKNPANTNAAFRITFAGGVTYNSTGITGNGINGTANTHYVPILQGLTNSQHICIYQRNDLGATLSIHGAIGLSPNNNRVDIGRQTISFMAINQVSSDTVTDAVGVGFLIGSRTASNVSSLYRKTVKIIASTTASTGLANVNTIHFCSRVNTLHSAANLAYAGMGFGLTDAECVIYSTLVQNFNTTLGRQV